MLSCFRNALCRFVNANNQSHFSTNTPCQATGLPAGWEVRHSNSKNLPYYFNPDTKESKWEPPEDTDGETLKTYMATYHTGNAVIAEQPTEGKIRCAHLLVKHRDSRRASSWRSKEITRTRDEAQGIIEDYERQIKAGKSLGDLATTESDCSSARSRGDLYVIQACYADSLLTVDSGFFGKGDMQKEFEEAAFKLKPGEISPIVPTQSGLHIIERLACLSLVQFTC